jgi:hypothetical protein
MVSQSWMNVCGSFVGLPENSGGIGIHTDLINENNNKFLNILKVVVYLLYSYAGKSAEFS